MKYYALIPLIAVLSSCSLTEDTNPVPAEVSLVENLITTDPSSPEPTDTLTANNPSTGEAWRVSLMIEDGFDITKNFQNILLFFEESGRIEAKLGEQSLFGRWYIERDSPRDELYLDFPKGTILEELDDDWYIVRRDDSEIVLEYDDEEYDGKLVLVRETEQRSIAPPYQSLKENAEALFAKMTGSNFGIDSFLDGNRDKTLLFNNAQLVFGDWGSVTVELDGQELVSGIWLVGFDSQSVLLDLDFPSQVLGSYLDDEWLLQYLSDQRINLVEKGKSDNKDRLHLRKK
ncbi:hypothetical protein [Lunatimonas salinarum]|uniref:hypothetical protein n=1 Tax=Lunatimonas salinarum TaxID=1774590 RepID=UPI001AE094A9|nr:hypothetical protein [Lunatimonas salinarum]